MNTLKLFLLLIVTLTFQLNAQGDPSGNDQFYSVNLEITPPYHNFGHAKIGDPVRSKEFTIKNQSDEFIYAGLTWLLKLRETGKYFLNYSFSATTCPKPASSPVIFIFVNPALSSHDLTSLSE